MSKKSPTLRLTFTHGFADGFQAPVPEAFAEAIRKEALSEGDIFYSHKEAYAHIQWCDSISTLDWAIQIKESMTGGQTVLFQKFSKSTTPTTLALDGTFKLHWDEFIERLKGGDFQHLEQFRILEEHKSREYILMSKPDEGDDNHGQPRFSFPAQRLNNASKALEEIAAICKGILCDGEITDGEAAYFNTWIIRHSEFGNIPWFKDVSRRVQVIFADGKLDDEEKAELRAIMEEIRGGDNLASNYSTRLPLDVPQPSPIQFSGRSFCITGKFAYGKRSKVVEAIQNLGGTATDNPPAKHTDYMIIGKFSSRDWKNSSYGLKIEKAVELRETGNSIRIVSEDHWRSYIGQLISF
ncbi:MAG: BRCT domain-containing protein [Verrucomicrobiales bacterium]